MNTLPAAVSQVRRRSANQQICVSVVVVTVLVTVVLGIAGCDNEAPRQRAASAAKSSDNAASRDHFALALEFLKLRDEHNLEQSAVQVVYHLNQWIRQQKSDPRWMIDRKLFSTLPLEIRKTPALEELTSDEVLGQLKFEAGDVLFIEECRWLHATAASRRDLAPDQEPDLDQWLLGTDLDPKKAEDLAICVRLFDWSVRNIQLDELLPYPKPSDVGPVESSDEDPIRANWPPPMRGVPGPGYQYHPWHVMLFGHGDMLQRARIFILLARQLHLDAVMLGIDTKSGRARPWLPAVVIGDQLFLFDAGLGLPIPGPEGKGIATLAQVQEDPGLLESLNVGSSLKYPVQKSDLANVVAMLDATPEYLAQRMAIVESHLPAAEQMVLSVRTGEVKKNVGACSGIKDLRLWAVPYETAMYQRAHGEQMARNAQLQIENFTKHGTFMGLSPLVRARRQHLLGNLNNVDDRPGAKTLYLEARAPNTHIEALDDPNKGESLLGLKRDPSMSDAQWGQILQQEKMLKTQGKENASYFIGLAHMDNGDFDIATTWLKKRTLDATPDGRWTSGARYNLARCYEQLGEFDKADQLLLIDESPQRHGNLLRVRLRQDRAKK